MPLEANLAGQPWEFDAEVAEHFDEMLARSIPQYDAMRDLVADLAERFAVEGTYVVDLGCSRGEALAPVIARLGARCRYVGCDVSEPMLAAARERFAAWGPRVDVRSLDLRTDYPNRAASVTLSILTLQFVPIEYRQRIVKAVYDHTEPGGAFVLVEKVLGSTADLDATLVDVYYDLKRRNGYSQDEVDRKRLSLEGVLVPVTARWNEELLDRAGFREVECVWRWGPFAGWLAVK